MYLSSSQAHNLASWIYSWSCQKNHATGHLEFAPSPVTTRCPKWCRCASGRCSRGSLINRFSNLPQPVTYKLCCHRATERDDKQIRSVAVLCNHNVFGISVSLQPSFVTSLSSCCGHPTQRRLHHLWSRDRLRAVSRVSALSD